MNAVLRLVRVESNINDGVFGVLTLNGEVFCVTLEPPDKKNEARISCIPTGQYTCKRFNSPKFGKTWQVMGVPNRNYILFHAGNTKNHTLGCILQEEKYGKIKNVERAVLNSGTTFASFLEATKAYTTLTLTVTSAY